MPAPLLVAALLVSWFGLGCDAPASSRTDAPAAPIPSARGTLVISGHGPDGARDVARHRHRWVRGPDYGAVADIDLRGFLDGRFIYGWNQPGQIHSRLGRRDSSARYGETELFRTIQRWDAIALPADATVQRASLQVGVEEGPERSLRLLLYAVKRDFEPGQGGTRRDNTSPPKPGEVWWGAARHEQEPWGLPGAGFASDVHPDADTPTMALAETVYDPGDASLVFESAALAAYVEAQSRQRAPLRFLLKLSDPLEDEPGTLLHLYTVDHGDLRNLGRRPVLDLTWSAPRTVASSRRRVHLENGRHVVSERLDVRGVRTLAVSFLAEEGADEAGLPTLQVRGGRGDEPGPWRSAAYPLDVEWSWAQVRVIAGRDPLELGGAFESSLRDTWVRTAPPEEQEVRFRFESPRGRRFEVPGTYQGDYTWSVSFVPDEVGRWRYGFEEDFLKKHYTSAEAFFDVVVLDRENAREQLRALADRLRAEPEAVGEVPIPELAPSFWRLERAALRLETPESLASESGRELMERLTEVRELLGGREVPERLKLSPMKRDF